MTARKPKAAPESAPADTDALRAKALDATLAHLATLPTHAARGRAIGVPESGLKTFRDRMRSVGSFVGGSRGADAAAVTPETMRRAYDNAPGVRRYVDAFIDAQLAAPVE